MVWSVGYGVAAALMTGLVVGLWAATVQAPPEAAGAVASGIGGLLGFLAFGGSLAVRSIRRGWSRATEKSLKTAGV